MNTKLKSLFFGVALALSSALVGQAQATKQPEAPAVSTKQDKPGNGAGFSVDSLGMSTNAIAPAFSSGWNSIHADHCEVYDSYLYVYDANGNYFYTTDDKFKHVIYPACQTGNYLNFYVYDSSNHWNRVYTYTYK
jgi:hypothetical protein